MYRTATCKVDVEMRSSMKKKIIPIIYANGAIALWQKDGELCANTLELAKCYNNNGADGILVVDISRTDIVHEETITLMKEIVRTTELELYTAGNIKKLEDIKKYVYTGAKGVFLNPNSDIETALWKEASERFGLKQVRMQEISVDNIEDFVNVDKINLKSYIGEKDIYIEASPSIDFYNVKQVLKKQGVLVNTWESAIRWSEFKLNSDGLMPVIVQDYRTNEVLMMAYMNETAFEETIQSGRMCYWSRSRKERWLKGETSGHYQYVKSLYLDCDNDTILAKVAQIGTACHTGAKSCFFKPLLEKNTQATNPHKVFEEVYAVIQDRKLHPKEGSYTNYLFDKGIDKILKKCGEEATEIIIAAKNPDPEEIKYEISDFLYHVMVLMVEKNVTWEDITRELANR